MTLEKGTVEREEEKEEHQRRNTEERKREQKKTRYNIQISPGYHPVVSVP